MSVMDSEFANRPHREGETNHGLELQEGPERGGGGENETSGMTSLRRSDSSEVLNLTLHQVKYRLEFCNLC